MLLLNLKRVFALRGIQNPYSQLVKLGISRPTAWNLLENKVASINNNHLERICEYLNCEPNDLYEWRPEEKALNTENHPLKALRREYDATEFSRLVAEIPLDKIEQVKEMLSELRKPAEGESKEKSREPDARGLFG